MATYIVLSDWTQQGVANFADTVDRYEAARGRFEEMGVNFKQIYWTLGSHDMVNIVDAPDDETMAAALPKGGIPRQPPHDHLARALSDEMRSVIAKAG